MKPEQAQEAKHTPGPWKVDYGHNTNFSKVIRIRVIAEVISGKEVLYERPMYSGRDDEYIATAELIASAPLLLSENAALLRERDELKTALLECIKHIPAFKSFNGEPVSNKEGWAAYDNVKTILKKYEL